MDAFASVKPTHAHDMPDTPLVEILSGTPVPTNRGQCSLFPNPFLPVGLAILIMQLTGSYCESQ